MYRPARENPSFSSSLLDEIYRSIDEPQSIREKQNDSFQNYPDVKRERKVKTADLIENWMENEVRSAAGFKRSYNSSSSSSDSSSGGGFSSSEAESGVSSRPKPIRTTTNRHYEFNLRDQQINMYGQRYQFEDFQLKPKHEGKSVKTKSRAMKIYGDLKKVKQPISPGGRLATFLNSLFTNGKNTKLSTPSTGGYDDGRNYNYMDGNSKSAGESTCSSATSFSRSCLSKTPSSRGKSSVNKKRSVRFYPVSVIVGDDCQPCGHKSLYGDESTPHLKFVKHHNTDESRAHSSEKTRRIEEAARNLLRNYQKKVECEFDLITKSVKNQNEINLNYESDDDDDDAASNASSDLFELENFSAIGMENYGDELPVYETTHLDWI